MLYLLNFFSNFYFFDLFDIMYFTTLDFFGFDIEEELDDNNTQENVLSSLNFLNIMEMRFLAYSHKVEYNNIIFSFFEFLVNNIIFFYSFNFNFDLTILFFIKPFFNIN